MDEIKKTVKYLVSNDRLLKEICEKVELNIDYNRYISKGKKRIGSLCFRDNNIIGIITEESLSTIEYSLLIKFAELVNKEFKEYSIEFVRNCKMPKEEDTNIKNSLFTKDF